MIVRTIPDDIWRAYEATVFCATVDGEDIRIRPGTSDARLEEALETRDVRTWAYITAWNPGSHEFPPEENHARHEQLRGEVARLSGGYSQTLAESSASDTGSIQVAWVPSCDSCIPM